MYTYGQRILVNNLKQFVADLKFIEFLGKHGVRVVKNQISIKQVDRVKELKEEFEELRREEELEKVP